jgi:hypothetical protein
MSVLIRSHARRTSAFASTAILTLGFGLTAAAASPSAQQVGANATGAAANSQAVQLCEGDWKTVQTDMEVFKAQVGVYPGPLPTDVSGTIGTAPQGIHPNRQILQLEGTVTINDELVGPWLKSYPYEPGHFQIALRSTTASHPSGIFVKNAGGTHPIPAVSTYTSTDCQDIK